MSKRIDQLRMNINSVADLLANIQKNRDQSQEVEKKRQEDNKRVLQHYRIATSAVKSPEANPEPSPTIQLTQWRQSSTVADVIDLFTRAKLNNDLAVNNNEGETNE